MYRDSICDGDRYGSLRYALYCLMPKGKARRSRVHEGTYTAHLCGCHYIPTSTRYVMRYRDLSTSNLRC